MKLTSRARLPGGWPILAAVILGVLIFFGPRAFGQNAPGGDSDDSGAGAADLRAAEQAADSGDLKTARTLVNKAAKAQPDSEDIHFYQAYVAYAQKDYAAAEKTLERLHRNSPQALPVTNNLALALCEQDDAAEKRKAIEYAEAIVGRRTGRRVDRIHLCLGALQDRPSGRRGTGRRQGHRRRRRLVRHRLLRGAGSRSIAAIRPWPKPAGGGPAARRLFLHAAGGRKPVDRLESRFALCPARRRQRGGHGRQGGTSRPVRRREGRRRGRVGKGVEDHRIKEGRLLVDTGGKVGRGWIPGGMVVKEQKAAVSRSRR